MSWHYLQGREAAYWEGSCLDGAPSALLRLIPTPAASCSQDRQTDALNRSPSGMTLRRSTGTDGAEVLTWFRGDSPVKTYRRQATEQDSTESGLDCGPSLPGSLAKCSPPLCGWKTAQCSLFGGLTEFSGTWPRWGMMGGGELLQEVTPGPCRNGNGSGLWPAPLKSDSCLATYPHASFARDHSIASLPEFVSRSFGMRICPLTSERIMGWPDGWTDLHVAATDKYQEWRLWHGES